MIEQAPITVEDFERTVRAEGADDRQVLKRLYEEANRWGDNAVMAKAFRNRARTVWITMWRQADLWEPERNDC